MPFLHLVLLLCVLLLNIIKLIMLDFVLVLGLLEGASNASGEGTEDIGGVCRGGGGGGGPTHKAWCYVIAVGVGVPHPKLAVVWGNGETCLLNLALVDSNAIDVCLIETLTPALLADMLLSSCPACKDKGKGGG